MWRDQDKVWMHYLNDIIASDVASAVFLSTYMRHALRGRTLSAYHEVADLQRYRLYRKSKKVSHALNHRVHLPFVFVLGKN